MDVSSDLHATTQPSQPCGSIVVVDLESCLYYQDISSGSISTLLCPTDHSSTLRETEKIPNRNGQLTQR